MNRNRIAEAVFCSLALLLGALPAQAGPPPDAPARRVSLAGLDPAAPADVAVLYTRLRHAAKSVCSYSSAPRVYSLACVNQAMDSAVRAIGWPLLAARRGDGRDLVRETRTAYR